MKYIILILLLLYTATTFAQTNGRFLKRKESFFGLHFDFHATLDDKKIGETFTPEMIDTMLARVKPDFVQVDCKGHPGITSYPTNVGTPVGGFEKDILKMWRAVTSKHNVTLYVHYSGVYDKQAIAQHPQWAAINSEGKLDSNNTSVYSPYVDELMIPQLKEVITNYGINGVWVDGDCWATVPDYSDITSKMFIAQTGISSIPRSSKDTNYTSFLDFSRQSFLQYVQHYARALHQFNPDFQIASNWAFSSFMPQPVTVDVDYLSGDLTPVNSVNSAAFEARCLASQGRQYKKPWDLMSWSFTLNWDRTNIQTTKSVTQLTQEAAEIIAMGGGYQCYFTQNRDGSIKPWQAQTMKGLSEFMRARQPWCQYAIPVRQVALLYSGEAHRRNIKSVFQNEGLNPIKGILTALLDNQQAEEVLMEHHLQGNMQKYALIVIPEWNYISPAFRKELLQYVSNGGKLLVTGADAVRLFEKEAGIILNGFPVTKSQWLGYNGNMAGVDGLVQPIALAAGTKAFGSFYEEQDLRYPSGPAASLATYGKGQIACLFANMGENYLNNQATLQRDFLNELVHKLFANPIVEIEGSHLVHVALNRLGNKTIIHLINTGGQHANKNVYRYDEVPPVGPLAIKLRIGKPSKLTLQPENKELNFSYKNGQVLVQMPKLEIHSMIVAE